MLPLLGQMTVIHNHRLGQMVVKGNVKIVISGKQVLFHLYYKMDQRYPTKTQQWDLQRG